MSCSSTRTVFTPIYHTHYSAIIQCIFIFEMLETLFLFVCSFTLSIFVHTVFTYLLSSGTFIFYIFSFITPSSRSSSIHCPPPRSLSSIHTHTHPFLCFCSKRKIEMSFHLNFYSDHLFKKQWCRAWSQKRAGAWQVGRRIEWEK